MMWLVTQCTTCPSHGLAPCESPEVAELMRPFLVARCPDCGRGPRTVEGPVATHELAPSSLAALPPDWADYF